MDFFWQFQCTKVTHKCFKHLCVPTPKCLNQPKRRGRETEPTENLHQPFCHFECRKVIPVFRMSEHWCLPLRKMAKMAIAPQKCILEQNFQLPTPLKFGSLVFLVLTETQNWCRPLRKMGKMHPRAKLPITDPPKVWVYGFLSVDGNAKLVSAITENGKNGRSFPKTHPGAKLPITNPP